MRPVAEFPMVHGAPTAAAAAPAHALNGTAPHSPWQSPVPYLFGELATMLGLIAFALLILACSYWKLSGYLDGGSAARGGDDGREKGSAPGGARPAVEFQVHVVVIMAGDERPTFLAKPATNRAVVELTGGAAPAASALGGDNDAGASRQEEKKQVEDNQQGYEAMSSPPHPGTAGAASRSHESTSTTTTALQESSQ